MEELIPEHVRAAVEEFDDIRTVWNATFASLPSAVQSIRDDLEAFAATGASDRAVRAVNTFLLEASAIASRILPEEVGNEMARYLGAIGDVFDGVGDGIEAFGEGDAAAAIEAMYKGVKAAAVDLIPAELQNDETYGAIVAVLDGTVGSLSRHVLEYKNLMAQSSVCWKVFTGRERRRPRNCDAGYTWDGQQWCMYGVESPLNIQSRSNNKYLNIWGGSKSSGANVLTWNNPTSAHSQWVLHRQFDGTYTIENIHAHTFLCVQGSKVGANVAVTDDPRPPSARWRLIPTGIAATWNVQSVDSGLYLRLKKQWVVGNNVIAWSSAEGAESQWRIRDAWGGEAWEEPVAAHPPSPAPAQAARVALLNSAMSLKRPSGALPARCDDVAGFTEKRGGWCYGPCPAGYEGSGARCKATCGPEYPSDSDRMCGKTPGAIAAAVMGMITGVVREVVTISGLVSEMEEKGIHAAGGLTGTMQALIDLGKPFAHPSCPVGAA
uniref:Ricin B lectin domain-containing protein n=1 Tax=Zooxanthella nutricula TaxID=1333877 RepID=A0A7S2I6U0_9DINO